MEFVVNIFFDVYDDQKKWNTQFKAHECKYTTIADAIHEVRDCDERRYRYFRNINEMLQDSSKDRYTVNGDMKITLSVYSDKGVLLNYSIIYSYEVDNDYYE